MSYRERIDTPIERVGFYFDETFGQFKFFNFVDDRNTMWFIAQDVINILGYQNINITPIIEKYDINKTSRLVFRQNITRETINGYYIYIVPRGSIIIDGDTFLRMLNDRKSKILSMASIPRKQALDKLPYKTVNNGIVIRVKSDDDILGTIFRICNPSYDPAFTKYLHDQNFY